MPSLVRGGLSFIRYLYSVPVPNKTKTPRVLGSVVDGCAGVRVKALNILVSSHPASTCPLELGWRLGEMNKVASVLALALVSTNGAQDGIYGFGSSTVSLSDTAILQRLKTIYATKLRPLERKSQYNGLQEPALSDAWFDAKPVVMLLGQYSVGKTSFIRYLLGRDFPKQHIGPEPTTDGFLAVMYGDQDKTTPGNALTSQPDTPFHSLRRFGNALLDKLEAVFVPEPILRRITLVDTPGVQAG